MKDATGILDADAAVDTQFGQVETSASLGLQESQTQVRTSSTSEQGLKIWTFRIPHGPLSSQTLRACETSANIQGEESCFDGTTSQTTVGTEQYSRSNELQLRKWQEQDSRIHFRTVVLQKTTVGQICVTRPSLRDVWRRREWTGLARIRAVVGLRCLEIVKPEGEI